MVGVFAILAAIPGGQIIDAIGVVVLAVWSMFQDPLDKPRRRAVRRVRLQIAAAELSLTVELVQAGVDESSRFQEKLEEHLRQSRTQRQDVVRGAARIRDLAEDILDEIREVGQWLEAYARGTRP